MLSTTGMARVMYARGIGVFSKSSLSITGVEGTTVRGTFVQGFDLAVGQAGA